jgi:hypothetical protein
MSHMASKSGRYDYFHPFILCLIVPIVCIATEDIPSTSATTDAESARGRIRRISSSTLTYYQILVLSIHQTHCCMSWSTYRGSLGGSKGSGRTDKGKSGKELHLRLFYWKYGGFNYGTWLVYKSSDDGYPKDLPQPSSTNRRRTWWIYPQCLAVRNKESSSMSKWIFEAHSRLDSNCTS